MILPILKDDSPILRKISLPVEVFDKSLADLANNLLETCRSESALGIAAVQCGVLKRVIVVSSDTKDYIVMVNPKITYKSVMKTQHFESCLSFSGRKFFVERPLVIKVEYQDLAGNPLEMEAKSWLAYCCIHEVDHLNCILLPDIAIKEFIRK